MSRGSIGTAQQLNKRSPVRGNPELEADYLRGQIEKTQVLRAKANDPKRKLAAQVKWALQTKSITEVAAEFGVTYQYVYGINACLTHRKVRAEP